MTFRAQDVVRMLDNGMRVSFLLVNPSGREKVITLQGAGWDYFSVLEAVAPWTHLDFRFKGLLSSKGGSCGVRGV